MQIHKMFHATAADFVFMPKEQSVSKPQLLKLTATFFYFFKSKKYMLICIIKFVDHYFSLRKVLI